MFSLRIGFSRASKPLLRLAIALALGSSSAHAALPQHFERLKEMRAILDDAAVVKAFGQANPIDRIERVQSALYRVSSGRCVMEVALVSDPAIKRPAVWYGTWAFVVKAGPLICP